MEKLQNGEAGGASLPTAEGDSRGLGEDDKMLSPGPTVQVTKNQNILNDFFYLINIFNLIVYFIVLSLFHITFIVTPDLLRATINRVHTGQVCKSEKTISRPWKVVENKPT